MSCALSSGATNGAPAMEGAHADSEGPAEGNGAMSREVNKFLDFLEEASQSDRGFLRPLRSEGGGGVENKTPPGGIQAAAS